MLSTCVLSTGVPKNPLQASSSIVKAPFGKASGGDGEGRVRMSGDRMKLRGFWVVLL